MSENEFFYWLQGFFELTLCDGPVLLSKTRSDCVKRHIALTRASLRRGHQLGERIARIEVCIEMIADGGNIDELTGRVRKEVAAQFEHVIDPGCPTLARRSRRIGDPWPPTGQWGAGPPLLTSPLVSRPSGLPSARTRDERAVVQLAFGHRAPSTRGPERCLDHHRRQEGAMQR